MFQETRGRPAEKAGWRRSIASGDRGAVILGRRPEGRGGGGSFFVKKAPPCSGCRPGISGPAWKQQRRCCWCNPAEARPCSWPVCSAGPPTGDAGDPKKPPAGLLLLRRGTRPGRRPPDPLGRGLFAPRSRFKKGRFVRLLVRVGGLGAASCHQRH